MYIRRLNHANEMHLLFMGFLPQETMRLTRYTDYAIRLLIYLGAREDEICSIRSIASTFQISHNNLMKVVQDLVAAGFVRSVRGRSGGLRLARHASDINLGALLRHTEELGELLDCPVCLIRGGCGMPSILSEATAAFIAVFDKYTVADLLQRKDVLRSLIAA